LRSRFALYNNPLDGKRYFIRESLHFINVLKYKFNYEKNKYVCKETSNKNHGYRKYTFYILPGFTTESCKYQNRVMKSVEDENPWMHTIRENPMNDTLLKEYMGSYYSQDTNDNHDHNPISFGMNFPQVNLNYNPYIVPYQPAKPAGAYSDNIAIGETIQNIPVITKNKDSLHNDTVRNTRDLYPFRKRDYPKIPNLTEGQRKVLRLHSNRKSTKKGGNKTRKGKRNHKSRKGKRKGFIYNA